MHFRCHFCRERLKPIELSFGELLLALAGVRHLYCPHCFEVRLRPVGWLKVLLSPAILLLRGVRWVTRRA